MGNYGTYAELETELFLASRNTYIGWDKAISYQRTDETTRLYERDPVRRKPNAPLGKHLRYPDELHDL